MRHKSLLKLTKTATSRKRVFSHAGAWPVSLEAGQTPAQARVFIWDGGRVAPGLVAAPASGPSRGEPGVTLTSDMELTVAGKKAFIRQQLKQKAGGGILAHKIDMEGLVGEFF